MDEWMDEWMDTLRGHPKLVPMFCFVFQNKTFFLRHPPIHPYYETKHIEETLAVFDLLNMF
jgi:hypothetical protein